jgi:transposase InsO family protein
METIYYEPSKPGSYGGVRPLARYSSAKASTVNNWLSSQDAYTLHKPIRKIFPRRKTYAKGIEDLYQADLADMQQLARFNDGYRFILTCVDVFSKRGFALPLKDKRGSSVAIAFDKIFSETTPLMLQTDRGTEFLNSQVQGIFRKYNIKHYWSLNDDIKAACVERFNRTLKTRMFRYLTHHRTNRWIDVLPDLIHSYNGSFHRSIGMAPNNVSAENRDFIARRLYPEKPVPKWKFLIGDSVRISKYKHIFQKGYMRNWTDEIFAIVDRYPTHPVTYGLEDLAGESIKGRFYEQELQRVNKIDDVFEVEKVVRTRKRNGKTEYYVKWQGYPDKFNSWTSDVFR